MVYTYKKMFVAVFILVFLNMILPSQIFSQPSDAQIIQDLTSEGVTSVTLGSNGSKVWEGEKYVWTRGAKIIRTAAIPEYPEAQLVVVGTVVYDIIGGKFIYVKFRVADNSYLGIPNPGESDVKKIIDKNGTEKLVGNWLYNNIVSEVNYKISDNPGWEWHTPKSVSLNIAAQFDMLSQRGNAVDKVEQIFRVRLYANQIKGAWESMLSTSEGQAKVLSSKKVSQKEYKRLKQEGSLSMIEEKKKAELALSQLPKINIPDFKSDTEIILYTHKMLREASQEEMEAYLMQVLAPGYFLNDSNVMLSQSGSDLIKKTIRLAHGMDITYQDAYCPDPVVAHSQQGMMEFYSKAGKGKTRIAVSLHGGAYKEGVLVGQKWKIHDLSIHIPNSEGIAYIKSFSDPNKLCQKVTDNKNTDSKITDNKNTNSAAVWQNTKLEDICMQIAFPGTNIKKTVKGKQYQYLIADNTGTYMVTAWKLDKKPDEAKALMAIDNVVQNFAKNLKFNITQKKLYTYEKIKGKDFTMKSGSNIIRCKCIVIGEFLYQLVLSTNEKTLTSNLETQFFDSFSVLK